ncbi:Arc family DNA-binding protein [Aquibium microcysteis]|uniref:Arc family DNA-binding protein n=1 Tax=Aquibium microcysteis TaxID=675281 RepID=UPI00165CF9C3|nr:Arc family DNA-binding protein [Aquibium microcysteis]
MTDREKYPSEAAERFQVRMPPGLRDRIKAAADANSRSMNTEIVATLDEKYPATIELDQDEFAERWLFPIIQTPDEDVERRAALIAKANAAAAEIHPNLGVWERFVRNRIELIFGIRDPSLVSPEVRNMIQRVIMSPKARP